MKYRRLHLIAAVFRFQKSKGLFPKIYIYVKLIIFILSRYTQTFITSKVINTHLMFKDD